MQNWDPNKTKVKLITVPYLVKIWLMIHYIIREYKMYNCLMW